MSLNDPQCFGLYHENRLMGWSDDYQMLERLADVLNAKGLDVAIRDIDIF